MAAIALAIAACGGDSGEPVADAAPRPDAAPVADASAGIDAAPPDAAAPDATACAAGTPCATNPSAPCRAGVTQCDTGAPVCADGDPVADGTACPAGTCVAGTCTLVVDAAVNLTADALVPGRSCAEAPQYAVDQLTPEGAILATEVVDDCIVPGDEVLLINLQGAPDATVNVGNWELLEVANVDRHQIAFASARTRSYGSAAGSDADVGPEPGQQRVAVIRVPRYAHLVVTETGAITAAAWDGATGGVVAFRADAVTVDGAITATDLGYRSGRWSRSDEQCDDSVQTEAGESITGPAVAQVEANGGGPGGISALTNSSFHNDTPLSATAGHATAGQPGTNGRLRTLGPPGAAYGVGDGSRLTMGSGSGGNLTCDTTVTTPILVEAAPPAAGIVALFGGDITVGATGSITASARDASRDTAASGGYVYLVGDDIALGDGRVTAKGAVAHGGALATAGMDIPASDGYVAIVAYGALSGTSDPPATVVTP
ncbi:MAG: hypothetical protein D6689_22315 [Deltaproteobacteria bacterium]|nr:MAG: hypothetical protein D6689_22315 [Deltaproteobacteria bacterium]